MLYLSEAIANSFLAIGRSAGEPLDPMKIQKLAYFSHGWHLGYGLGALSAEHAEAWRWGPVFPQLHHAVKRWGSGPIMKDISVFARVDTGRQFEWTVPKIPAEEISVHRLLQRVWKVYGHMSGAALAKLTHEPAGPWSVTRKQHPGVQNMEITNRTIAAYFKGQLQENAGKT